MALKGYISVEFDVKSPVLKFFQFSLRILNVSSDNGKTEFPKLEPEEQSKVQYRIEDCKISEWYKKIASMDSEVANGQNPDSYTKLEGTMTVTDTEYKNGGRAGRAIWTVQYEKISDDIEDPQFITDTTAKVFQRMDEGILAHP